MLGQTDALRDDGLQMAARLAEAKVDFKITEMELMPHGFLNFDFPLLTGMAESQACIEQTFKML